MSANILDKKESFIAQMKEILIDTKKVSHAYLIETNSFPNSEELVFTFAKMLLCPSYFEDMHTTDCVICHQISENSYADLKVIRPEGDWIKKEQMLSLQEAFKTKSIIGGRRCYIIFEAEKLNASSANTLLKFLEEPADQIVAILVTANRYQILDTILSRCQVYSLSTGESNLPINFEQQKDCYDFLNLLYQKGSQIIAVVSKLEVFSQNNKREYQEFLRKLEEIYDDLLIHLSDDAFLENKYGKVLTQVLPKLSYDDIIEKLKVIEECKQKLKFNVNLKLWLDNFIIQLSKG